MDRQRLRGMIIGKYGTQERFAKEVLGISGTTLTTKLRRGTWTLRQVMQITEEFQLSAKDVWSIFFADDVGKILNKEK